MAAPLVVETLCSVVSSSRSSDAAVVLFIAPEQYLPGTTTCSSSLKKAEEGWIIGQTIAQAC